MALAQINDSLNTFTGYAREAVSAGQLVKAGSDGAYTNAVTSAGVSSYDSGDIQVMLVDASGDGKFVAGIALEDASSGGTVTVATEGLFILPTQEAVTPGNPVMCSEVTDAFANSVSKVNAGDEIDKIGRALSGTSASGTYAIIALRV